MATRRTPQITQEMYAKVSARLEQEYGATLDGLAWVAKKKAFLAHGRTKGYGYSNYFVFDKGDMWEFSPDGWVKC